MRQRPIAASMVGLMMACALSVTPDLASAQVQGWSEGSAARQVSMRELIPRMSSGQAYSERYGFSVDLEGGGHIGMDFTISNLGIRSGYGAAQVRVRLPGQERYEYGERVSRGDWTTAEDRFALDIAKTQVEARGDDTFVLRHDGDVKVELTFRNTMPMWRPGSGQIRQGEDYYRFTLISPRADVQGRVQIDGEWHTVEASRAGYADHVATNVAPYELAKRFSRFRDYNDDVFVIWREIELSEKFGGRTLTWAMVGVGERIVFSDADAQLRPGNVRGDGETGYQVPHAVQLEGESGQGEMRFVMRGDRMEKKDLLASYGRAARLVASALSKPWQYNIHGDYALEVEVGGRTLRTRGRGHYTVDFVNP
ncbi:carotenoid 1,2-hydratase [Lujinxingia vulgaris]|uniref:Carotenoid 1,2-hydratase n=1 Tax=Lujinxingia vulgaris TaxID=2600176 RepID=A0A5C6WXN0_9DELT|nr:carotenoid 1,2-hydratase [Lujinxingia vulgaris]TXD34193.1 carotenoid 1,2-hydratase [Lujinxingia vulgaris]